MRLHFSFNSIFKAINEFLMSVSSAGVCFILQCIPGARAVSGTS